MIEGGRVVERGSHETLLAADGRYAAQWRVQTGALMADLAEGDATRA